MDLGYFYVGFGLPSYRQLAQWSIMSARRWMPQATIHHWTDRHTPPLKGADVLMRSDADVGTDILITAKALNTAAHGMQAKDIWALSDVDVVWQDDLEKLFVQDFDVALVWRDNPAMPYNGGLMMGKPSERAKAFWERFAHTVHSLPRLSDGWWSEQLALASMLGNQVRPHDTVIYAGARVRIFDAEEILPSAKEGAEYRVPGYGVHFKGTDAKAAMWAYAQAAITAPTPKEWRRYA